MMGPAGNNKKTLRSFRGFRRDKLPFLSFLEEVAGDHLQAGVLTDGSGASAPFPAGWPVVTGGRLANHSGGSVRESHPLPLLGSNAST